MGTEFHYILQSSRFEMVHSQAMYPVASRVDHMITNTALPWDPMSRKLDPKVGETMYAALFVPLRMINQTRLSLL